MTDAESRDPAYVEHMLEAIGRIRRYVGRKRRAGFLGNALLQDAVIRNIEIIGEAAGRLSPEFAARHPGIPWREIVGMRHRLIHGYLKVNVATVWEVVEQDLPSLKRDLQTLVAAPAQSVRPPAHKRGASPPSRTRRARRAKT